MGKVGALEHSVVRGCAPPRLRLGGSLHPRMCRGHKIKAAIGGFWPQPSDGSPEASNRTAPWYPGMSTDMLDIFALIRGQSQFGPSYQFATAASSVRAGGKSAF